MASRDDAEHRPCRTATVSGDPRMANKARKSKFFRVATEGATTDGRKIERKWLQEIAATYSTAKYGARIFIEHIRGYNPNAEAAFRCMGDVVAVEAREVEDGKLALFAQIDPTNEMVKMTTERQKIYGSIEVAENFANTGMAYLVGLGVTDSPASLGTEILAFAAQNPDANPFSSRKQAPGNVITACEEITIEFEDETPEPGPSLFSRIKDLLKGKSSSDDERFSDVHQAVEHIAEATTEVAGGVEDLRKDFATLKGQLDANKAAHEKAIADLTTTINHTPNREPQRPAAAGGTGAVATDC